ncbi:50S ribosomal protein L11 methyltransferase [Kaarinaea lacus]
MLMALRVVCICSLMTGCTLLNNSSLSDDEINTLIQTSKKQYVKQLSREVAVFDNVAFGLGLPLRNYLNNERIVKGKTILDLGAGSGVLSLIALQSGAKKSVATEINPYAVANAVYNAERLGFENKMDVRLVSMDNQGAYSVIANNEKFDLIVSNPPQGLGYPNKIYDYSHTDSNLAFLTSILEGLKEHLTPDGKGVFALYDRGLELAQQVAGEQGLDVNIYLKTYNRNGVYYLVEIQSRQG